MYETLFPCVESDPNWVAVALAWCTYVSVPLPGALRMVSEPHCRVFLFSTN